MGYLAKVAVITRTKNRALLLERALQSVLNQTYEDWFLVVVNDGGEREPVDHLIAKYADRFAGRVAVLHNECSRGMEAASNQGIAYGESEYLVIHDDDDSWAPQFLMMCVNELERVRTVSPSVQGVITYSLAVWERIERGSIVVETIEPYNAWIPKGLLSFFRMAESNMYPPISFLYRREALATTHGYRQELPVLGDWDFNLRFMSSFDVFLVPQSLAFYHHRRTATGDLGNSVIAGVSKIETYYQYLRNDLLRQDIEHGASGLGTIVNLSHGMKLMKDEIHQLEWRASQGGPRAHARAQAGIAAGTEESTTWLPIWFVASVMTFARSQDRRELMTKFWRHWKQESPRRALSVVARFGYLALGGK